jgi:heterotetrameric sarcosine oxidase gamma subunit
VFERYSVLADALKASGRVGAGGLRRLRIGEFRGWTLVQVAAFATTDAQFQLSLRPVLNGDLPTRVGDVVHVDGRRLLKTAAEQYWVITREGDDILRGLQSAIPPQIGAITALSHSRTCIFVEGSAAREMLAKAVPLDFHPDSFRVDQFALTGLHHSPVLIHRSAEDLYEIYALRTFGLSVWEWLIDAALPFGYEVVG